MILPAFSRFLRMCSSVDLDPTPALAYKKSVITYRGVTQSDSLEKREQYLADLKNTSLPQAVLLSTCDRVEVYEGEGLPSEETLLHLFRVVCGLESPLLGENQIQGQVKRAYAEASAATKLNSGMHRLFQNALRVGKRVRSETRLNTGALGHAQVVVNLINSFSRPLTELKIMIIGVTSLNRAILRFLLDRGNTTFIAVNRTLEKAQALCAELGAGTSLSLESMPEKLATVDVLISSTSAPHTLVLPHYLPDQGGPQWFFDLAMPRDIDPSIANRSGITLFNISDLENAAQKSMDLRREEVAHAESIIVEEVKSFYQSPLSLASV